MEKTYIMLKPDAYRKKIYGKVIDTIENAGFTILNAKMLKLSQEKVDEHYAHLLHLNFYQELSDFMQSGPVLAMIVEGENAIAGMRELMGPTKNAKELAPNSIRGLYSDSITENVIHGSDSPETATIEIERFFGTSYTL